MKAIKRISLFTLLCFTLFIVFSIDGHADVGDIEWSIDNPYSTYYAATISIDVPQETYKLTFVVPESDRHLLGDGGIDSYVAFNFEGVAVQTYDIPEIKGSQIYGTYYFNLDAMGLYQQIDEIVFYIMQEWSSPPDIPTYVTSLNTRSELIYNYNLPYDITLEWASVYLFGDYYGVYTEVELLSGTKSISLFIPTSQFHEILYNGIYAQVIFYGSVDEEIHKYNLTDTGYVGGLHLINLQILEDEGFSELPSYTYDQIEYMKITIPQNYDTNIPDGYLDYLTDNSSITYNDNIKRVIYYNETFIHYQELFDTIPTQPDDPIKSSSDPAYYYEFVGWYRANGYEYNYSPVRDEDVIDNTFFLYAKFNKLINQSYTPDEPTADYEGRLGAIFFNLGWDQNTGYLIVLVISLGASLFVYIKYAMSPFIVIIIDSIILGLFTYLGFLPVFVAIALWAFLFIAFIMTRRD